MMNAKDITRRFSANGNSHSWSRSINRAIGRSRSHTFTDSIRRSLGRSSMLKSSRSHSHSSGVAMPLLLGIGAVALVGAGIDYAMRRSGSTDGIMSRMNGMLGSVSLDRLTGGRKYSNVHGTAGAEMPEPQANA